MMVSQVTRVPPNHPLTIYSNRPTIALGFPIYWETPIWIATVNRQATAIPGRQVIMINNGIMKTVVHTFVNLVNAWVIMLVKSWTSIGENRWLNSMGAAMGPRPCFREHQLPLSLSSGWGDMKGNHYSWAIRWPKGGQRFARRNWETDAGTAPS